MNGNKKDGFSMVEVLVASTILIVIVMMMAMLFQQTSVAWRTGLMRARGYMQLRSYIGAVQRDASAAIDAKNLPAQILTKGKQEFTSDALKFYTLSGKDDERALKFITHDKKGTRTESVLSLDGSGTWEPESSSEVLTFLTSESGANDPTVNPLRFGFKWTDGPEYGADGKKIDDNKNRFPLYITLDAEIVQEGKLYGVGAASAGPDMKWDTKDDIRTWVE